MIIRDDQEKLGEYICLKEVLGCLEKRHFSDRELQGKREDNFRFSLKHGCQEEAYQE